MSSQSKSLRTRKDKDVTTFLVQRIEFKDPRMRNIDVPKQEFTISEMVNSLFLFSSPRAFTTFMRMYLLSPPKDSNIFSSRDTLIVMVYQLPGIIYPSKIAA
jgi:hypothetical protein